MTLMYRFGYGPAHLAAFGAYVVLRTSYRGGSTKFVDKVPKTWPPGIYPFGWLCPTLGGARMGGRLVHLSSSAPLRRVYRHVQERTEQVPRPDAGCCGL